MRVERVRLEDVAAVTLPDVPRALRFVGRGEVALVGCADGTVLALDAATGRTRWSFRHQDAVVALAEGPDGVVVTGSQDGSCAVLRADGQLLHQHRGLGGWVSHVAFTGDGRVLAAAAGRTLHGFGLDGTALWKTAPFGSTLSGLEPFGDDQLATCCYAGVHFVDARTSERVRSLEWKGSLISLLLSPNQAVIAAGSQDCSVHFWRLATGADSEMRGYAAKSRVLAWAPDSSLLVTTGGAVLTGWRFDGAGPEGTSPLQLKGHEDLVTALAYDGSGLLVSGSMDKDVLVWRPKETPKPVGFARLSAAVEVVACHGPCVAAADTAGRLALMRARTVE